MKTIRFLIAAALLLCGSASAQNWTGAVSSDWNNAANWSATPGNGDDIVIDPANYTGAMAQPVISANSSFTPAEMLVQNGAQLTIAASLNASDRVEILGAGTVVTLNTGTFALNGGGNNARLIFAEDGHFEMNGGTLTVGQRLLFELGGTGEINGGTVTVGETIALVDGSAATSSRLVQNGGTITVNAEFGFENEAGNFFPVFEQTAGTLNINGSLLWLGAAPGSGRGYFLSTGGTTHITETIGNDPTSTMNMHIGLSGTALLENAGTSVALLAGDSVVVTNDAHWLDMNTVGWQNAGVFHAADGGLFTSGNTTLSGAGSWQFDQMIVPTLKLLNHVSPATMSVSGDMTVAGVFSHNANRLILNGTQLQTITATASGLNVYDIDVQNSAAGIAVLLNDHLNVSHDLQLTDGIVSVDAAAAVKLADNATATGGSDSTFVVGYMEKAGDDALIFPLGAAPDRYRPLTITAPASTATVVRAAYRYEPYIQLTPVQTPLQAVSAIEYWDLSRTGSGDLFSAAIGWNDAAQSGLTDCAVIAQAVWNGTEWVFVASTTSGLCTGDNAGSLIGSVQLPVIGPLTIGFTGNMYQQVVELCPGESITVGANTYTTSGVYTDVLQDVNGDDSTVVTILTVLDPLTVTVTDNLTSITANAAFATGFQWVDCNNGFAPIVGATGAEFHPAVNGSYAVIATRDSCTDSDTSVCVVIDQLGTEEPAAPVALVYPNPVATGGKLTIFSPMEMTSVTLFTTDGRVVMQRTAEQGTGIAVDLPQLPQGTYLLVVETVNGTLSPVRLVVGN